MNFSLNFLNKETDNSNFMFFEFIKREEIELEYFWYMPIYSLCGGMGKYPPSRE